jgi:hypothetical protein
VRVSLTTCPHSLHVNMSSNRSSPLLPFGRLGYGEPNAIGYGKFYSRSHEAVMINTMGSQMGEVKTAASFIIMLSRAV